MTLKFKHSVQGLFPSPVSLHFSSVQLLSRFRLYVTPWTTAHQASQSIIKSQSSPKLMSIEAVMTFNHLILCRPLLPPAIFPSIRVFFKWISSSHQWPKYWGFSFNISPSKKHSRMISFRMDWLDLLAVQGTLWRLLQHHSSKASILQLSGFLDFPDGSDGKASVDNVGDLGSIPGSGRFPGEGNSNPLQYSCLENPMDGVARCRLLCPWGRKELEMTEWLHFTHSFLYSPPLTLIHDYWKNHSLD